MEKRQLVYERWKTQVQYTIIVDKPCFPGELEKISYITGQLTDKAWDSVQDGAQIMNKNHHHPKKWAWETSEELWSVLDGRYMLLDVTPTAKNKLYTLFRKSAPMETSKLTLIILQKKLNMMTGQKSICQGSG